MTWKHHDQVIGRALRLLVEKCPRLAAVCYWAGTSSIAIEELRHRQSFDLDFHTRKALDDVRPVLAEIQKSFPGRFELVQAPDAFGSGFTGVLTLPDKWKITIQVLSNYEDVSSRELVPSSTVKGLRRVSLKRYLADKIQCIVERSEARDLVDFWAVLKQHPGMRQKARRLVAQQDALLLAERLLAWSPQGISEDLEPYPDVNAKDAVRARDLLLKWLKEEW